MVYKKLAGYKMLALLSVFLQAITVIALKLAALSCGYFFCISLFYLYIAPILFIILRVLFWNLALSKTNLSNVYVFTALTPMILLLLSTLVLGEKITLTSATGAGIVVLAIYMQQHHKQKSI